MHADGRAALATLNLIGLKPGCSVIEGKPKRKFRMMKGVLAAVGLAVLLTGCMTAEERTAQSYPIGQDGQTITARYGDNLPITIHLPKDAAGSVPVLIMNHGRPFRNVNGGTYTLDQYHPLVFRMNAADIAVAVPVRRGYFSAPGSNGERISCNDPVSGQFSRALQSGQKDILAAIQFVGTLPQIDGERIFVGGTSAGGYLTLGSLDAFPPSVKAAFSFNGGRCGKRGPLFNGIEFAEPLIASAAAGSSIPVKLFASQKDDVTPPQSTRRLYDVMCQARGGCRDITLAPVTNATHDLGSTSRQAGEAAATFLNSVQ